MHKKNIFFFLCVSVCWAEKLAFSLTAPRRILCKRKKKTMKKNVSVYNFFFLLSHPPSLLPPPSPPVYKFFFHKWDGGGVESNAHFSSRFSFHRLFLDERFFLLLRFLM